MTNRNADLHFNGPQHRNKVMLAFHRQPQNVAMIWCRICCCELNTEKALELHNQSPKHKKKEEAYEEIMELKRVYLLEKAKPLGAESSVESAANENDKKNEANVINLLDNQ